MRTILITLAATFTCWQMLAYLASTLAFSAMARADGQPSEIFRTDLHLAKSQPSFLYWAQRSESPSRPAGRRWARDQVTVDLSFSVARHFWAFGAFLTLCGGLSVCSIQTCRAFVHLDQGEADTNNAITKICMTIHRSGLSPLSSRSP